MLVDDDMFSESLKKLESLCPDENLCIYRPDSIVWNVYRYSCCLWGGLRAALMQLALPEVAQAIDDHSTIATDPYARLRRTFLFVSQANYGPRWLAFRLAKNLRAMHENIHGKLPDGTRYSAHSEKALFWVHGTLVDTAVTMFELCKRPLSNKEKDQLVRETYKSALLMGLYDESIHWSWDTFQNRLQDISLRHTAPGKAASRQAELLFHAPFPFQPVMNQLIGLTQQLLPVHMHPFFSLHPTGSEPVFLLQILNFIYQRLPEKLQWMPPYPEALNYYKGQKTYNPLTLLGNSLMVGQSRLFSVPSSK